MANIQISDERNVNEIVHYICACLRRKYSASTHNKTTTIIERLQVFFSLWWLDAILTITQLHFMIFDFPFVIFRDCNCKLENRFTSVPWYFLAPFLKVLLHPCCLSKFIKSLNGITCALKQVLNLMCANTSAWRHIILTKEGENLKRGQQHKSKRRSLFTGKMVRQLIQEKGKLNALHLIFTFCSKISFQFSDRRHMKSNTCTGNSWIVQCDQ